MDINKTETKICIGCKKEKSLTEFYKTKKTLTNKGVGSYCKECNNIKKLNYSHTKYGWASATYNNQKKASKSRGHRLPEYTKDELYEWTISQKIFNELFKEWEMSGWKKYARPSIDRINDNIHYCFGNIQLMSWADNEQKAHNDMRIGKLKHGTKPQKQIEQYTLDFEYIATYPSSREASRVTGIGQGTISGAACGKQLTAGGYRWKQARASFEEWRSTFKTKDERRVTKKKNKSVDMLDLKGNYIATYYSMAKAAEVHGLNRGCISNCVKGKIIQHVGYKWRLADGCK